MFQERRELAGSRQLPGRGQAPPLLYTYRSPKVVYGRGDPCGRNPGDCVALEGDYTAIYQDM